MTNAGRARNGAQCIVKHREIADNNEDTTQLVDMLADLRHWAASVKIDYDNCDRLGQMHFEAETTGEEP